METSHVFFSPQFDPVFCLLFVVSLNIEFSCPSCPWDPWAAGQPFVPRHFGQRCGSTHLGLQSEGGRLHGVRDLGTRGLDLWREISDWRSLAGDLWIWPRLEMLGNGGWKGEALTLRSPLYIYIYNHIIGDSIRSLRSMVGLLNSWIQKSQTAAPVLDHMAVGRSNPIDASQRSANSYSARCETHQDW